MAYVGKKVYRKRKPVKIILLSLLGLICLLITLAICVFFGFKKYIVYTSDGLYLDVPWLSEEAAQDNAVPEGSIQAE
ncbi:MAG: hypothetical protein AB7C97_01545 [Oscillospiraceae bacterium]